MNRLYMKRNIQGELVSIDFLEAMGELSPAQHGLLINLLKSPARNKPENAWTIQEVSRRFDLSYEAARRYLKALRQLGFLEQVDVEREGSPKKVHAYYISIELARKVNEPTHTVMVNKIANAKMQAKIDLSDKTEAY